VSHPGWYPAGLNVAGWVHLVYFGLILPAAALRHRRLLLSMDWPLPGRRGLYQRTAFGLVLLAGMSIAVASVQGIELFSGALPSFQAVLAGVAMYAAAVAFMRPRWRRAVQAKTRVVHLYMPSDAAERGWWLAVSFLAGTCEEITWRGVQSGLIVLLTGSYWLAALLCSASFALTHMIQGWRSVAIIAVFAMGFHGLVWLAGSLYVAMAVHVAYDVTAGLAYGKLGFELWRDGGTHHKVTEDTEKTGGEDRDLASCS
jgi:membrane protease YdiL (CAAX protease family)